MRTLLETNAWAAGILKKTQFLRSFEGAYTAADYAVLEEDERELITFCLGEFEKKKKTESENVKR